MRAFTPSLAFLLAVGTPAFSAEFRVVDSAWCNDGNGSHDDKSRHCEIREATWAGGTARTDVDASPNGGIEVRGWDRPEVKVQARVEAYAPTPAEAQSLAGDIRIENGAAIHASGPSGNSKRHWWVSYRMWVPQGANLSLRSVNGGLSLTGLSGTVELSTTNGGIHLEDAAGRVVGRTTNGGLDVQLAGSAWKGPGLDLETTNGGVNLNVPAGYNARLQTGTTNGDLRVDFPVSLQGRISRKDLAFDLGTGGSPIRAMTTNGGVTVRRR